MSEELVIRYCAPTLAGIKTGSLFSYAPETGEDLRAEIRRLNRMLVRKGLRDLPLSKQRRRVMIYVYRPERLRADFRGAQTGALLRQQGYCSGRPEQCVAALMAKLRDQEDFPHEIGLFLGYPPEDVRGFMEHRGCGCKCVGCWKVYGDVQRAAELFARYQQCTDIYLHAWQNGKSIEELAVRSAS